MGQKNEFERSKRFDRQTSSALEVRQQCREEKIENETFVIKMVEQLNHTMAMVCAFMRYTIHAFTVYREYHGS